MDMRKQLEIDGMGPAPSLDATKCESGGCWADCKWQICRHEERCANG
jgi:hypothetical protein